MLGLLLCLLLLDDPKSSTPADPKKLSPEEAAYVLAADFARDVAIGDAKLKLEKAEARNKPLKNPNAVRKPLTKSELNARIKAAKNELEALNADKGRPTPAMRNPPSVGSIGAWKLNARIIQVIGPDAILASLGDATVWISGIDTSGMADGQSIRIKPVLYVNETKRYTSALGAAKTVLAARPAKLDMQKINAAFAVLDAKEVKDKHAKVAPKTLQPVKTIDEAKRLEAKLVNARQLAKAMLVDKARAIYEQVIAEAPESDAAGTAKKELAVLKAGGTARSD